MLADAHASRQSFYQAQKFARVSLPEAQVVVDAIRSAPSPEAAARLGRLAQLTHPELVRPDWDTAKWLVMRSAVAAKCAQHSSVRALLRSTGETRLVEDSPNDYVWGVGRDGSGRNELGLVLEEARASLRSADGR